MLDRLSEILGVTDNLPVILLNKAAIFDSSCRICSPADFCILPNLPTA